MATGIALIGSGIFAKEEHLPAIRATPLLELKAVYSRSLNSARTLASELKDIDLYSEDEEGKGYDELLKRDDIVGVVIALPILVQPDFIQRALAAGKHVLAEKPIAKDVSTAASLLDWYDTTIGSKSSSTSSTPTFTIAENFRFLESFIYASQQISQLGRILEFKVRVSNNVQLGGKYIETAWRKVPEYQGGFLLDGGVHFIAGLRLMLQGGGEAPVRVSAFTVQLQEHLPPVDTLNATLQLKNGASGTLSVSFGTTFSGQEYAVAAEKGTVTVTRGKVVVKRDGQEEAKEFPEEGNGVQQEIKAWAESLVSGKPNPQQSPEEALRDLELLEACLRSGEKGGAPVELRR